MLAGSRPVPSKGTRLFDAVTGFVGMIVFKLFLVIPVVCALYLYYELFAYGSDRKNTETRRQRDSHKYFTRKRAPKRSAQFKPLKPNFANVALSNQPTADVQVDGSPMKKNCCTAENTRRKLRKRAWSWPRKCVSDGDSPGENLTIINFTLMQEPFILLQANSQKFAFGHLLR